MIKKTKNILSNSQYRKLISNFSYLSIINIINKILPLIIVPYIVRTIGVDKYGIIAFAWAMSAYFILITQYSFDLTAVKHISINRENHEELNRYTWAVLITKFLLAMFTLVIFIVALLFFKKLSHEYEVMIFAFIMVFADIFMPLFFFRGLEEMKYIAIFNIVSKLLYAVSIFIFVHEKSDYIWIPLLNSLSLLSVGLYALYYIHKKYKLQFILVPFHEVKLLLVEGKDIFLSNLNVSFYTMINPIILGMFSSYTAVGIYSLAEAIYNAYSTIIKSYVMVIYPHLARYVNNSKKLFAQARKFFLLYIVVLLIAASILFLLSDFIITTLYGEGNHKSIIILQILAISLLLEPLGGFFTGYLSLKSQYKTIRSITFKTMLINIVLVVPVIYFYHEVGLAYLFLLLSVIQVSLNLSHNKEVLSTKSTEGKI